MTLVRYLTEEEAKRTEKGGIWGLLGFQVKQIRTFRKTFLFQRRLLVWGREIHVDLTRGERDVMTGLSWAGSTSVPCRSICKVPLAFIPGMLTMP